MIGPYSRNIIWSRLYNLISWGVGEVIVEQSCLTACLIEFGLFQWWYFGTWTWTTVFVDSGIIIIQEHWKGKRKSAAILARESDVEFIRDFHLSICLKVNWWSYLVEGGFIRFNFYQESWIYGIEIRTVAVCRRVLVEDVIWSRILLRGWSPIMGKFKRLLGWQIMKWKRCTFGFTSSALHCHQLNWMLVNSRRVIPCRQPSGKDRHSHSSYFGDAMQ